jgi:hypothetical protein
MLELSPEFKTHLNQSVTTVCVAWKLELSDSRLFGFSNHDRPLEIDGLSYAASSSLTETERETRLGFLPDNGSIQGVLDTLELTDEDIENGVLIGARLSRLKVNWADPTQYAVQDVGELGQVTRRGDYFGVEWLGLSVKLNRSTGRVYSKKCDAEFGDKRCGLSVSDFADSTVCPKTFVACRDQFRNSANFRGFPYLLGDDALFGGVQNGEVKDGGSRYR